MPNLPYDEPGEPFDSPPPDRANRRRHDYRRESESDDAWAAADEDAGDGGMGVEGLAAGYDWSDDTRYGVTQPTPQADLGPLAPNAERARRRVDGPRQERIHRRYDRASLYPESPSFRRDSRTGPINVDPFHQSRASRPGAAPNGAPNGAPMPRRPAPQPVSFMGILLLVMLGMIALGSVILACVAVLFWL